MATWTIEVIPYKGGATFEIKDKDRRICQILGSVPPRDKKAKHATARLLASAPDMLKALKDILSEGMTQATVERAAAVVREIDE